MALSLLQAKTICNCMVKVKAKGKWYYGNIEAIHDDGTMSIKYDHNGLPMQITTSSNNIRSMNEANFKLRRGSNCKIFSNTTWCDGIVTDIAFDNIDLLIIKYCDENYNIIETQRHRYSESVIYQPNQSLLHGIDHLMTEYYYPWFKIKNPPDSAFQVDIAMINDHEFMMAMCSQPTKFYGADRRTYNRGKLEISRFDMKTLQWILSSKPSITNLLVSPPVRVVYDEYRDELYALYTTERWNIMCLSFQNVLNITVVHNYISNRIKPKPIRIERVKQVRREIQTNAIVFNTNELIHIWQNENDKGTTHFCMHKATSNIKWNKFESLPYGENVAFSVDIRSQNNLLVMGKNAKMYEFDHGYNLWTHRNCGDIPADWGKNDDIEAIMTNDEEYAILILKNCESNDIPKCKCIWIMHNSKYNGLPIRFRMCSMKLPDVQHGDERRLVVTYEDNRYNENFVNGFMRDTGLYIPLDVLRLVLYYCISDEWLHVLCMNDVGYSNRHYIIPIKYIRK